MSNDRTLPPVPWPVPPPFVVFALPRSRTTWLSGFLSYGPWACGHDEIRHWRSLEDVKSYFLQPYAGTVETNGAQWWRLLERFAPGARVVTVRRPVAEVLDSLAKLGLDLDRPQLLNGLLVQDRKLDQIEARVPGTISVQYSDLATVEGCQRVFETCLRTPMDLTWWQAWNPVNLQVDLRKQLRYWMVYLPQSIKLVTAAKQAMLADLVKSRPLVVENGLVIQEEPYETVWQESKNLFEQHCVAVDEPPDFHLGMNTELMERMDQAGLWQIVTARVNGRIFGYLSAVVGPSLERSGFLTATQLGMFVSKDAAGMNLPVKLQRAMIDGYRRRKVSRAIMRAGVRGDGPKLETLYRRVGAKPFGNLYSMDLD